jgi:ABC-type uncharacterized transport system permease subunit
LETLNIIYLTKICLGLLTALICILVGVNDLLSGVGLALMIYLGSDRILKQVFVNKVEKPNEITKTGIGIYIIMWLFSWILIFTFMYSISPLS